jgi:hypothetical protein
MIDKKDRTLFNQALGGAAGAGVGYVGGGYLNEALQPKDPKSIYGRLKKSYIEDGPEALSDAPMNAKERELYSKIIPGTYYKRPKYIKPGDEAYHRSLQEDALEKFRDDLRAGWADQQKWRKASNFYSGRAANAVSRIKDRGGYINRILRTIPGINELRGEE